MKEIAKIPFPKWALLILELVCFVGPSESAVKNVCRTMDDYKMLRRNNNAKCWYDPDVGASPEIIARNHDYPFETHQVVTEDGFILALFRIPSRSGNKKNRPPVLLHHGLTVDGTSWIMNGKQSSAFVLSDNGFDVWILNVRGTLHSSKHMKYNSYEEQYWNFRKFQMESYIHSHTEEKRIESEGDQRKLQVAIRPNTEDMGSNVNFSFHEMGYYDLPAIVDYIAITTGKKGQLTLIGISMGTTSSLIYASLRSKHAQENLKGIVALAPVAFMDNARSIVKFAARYTRDIKQALQQMEISGFGENMSVIIKAIRGVCSTYPYLTFCIILMNLVTGPSTINPENLPIILSQSPLSASMKTFEHYSQILTAKERFQMFDYGASDNAKIYNSTEPPLYELSKIKVPITLFYGDNDFMAEEKDVINLYSKLNSNKSMIKMAFEDGLGYSHIDFVVGKEVDRLFHLVSKHIKSEYGTS